MFEDDTLYANANNSRALVKLRDADGDGKYEERTVLMETPGGVGHGRNQIALRPRANAVGHAAATMSDCR